MDSNEQKKEEAVKELSVEDIIKEGENIYPISEESDRKSFDINRIKNWSEIFYNIKQEKTRKRFNELMSKSEYSNFFEALSYEYGINGKTQDLQKALNIYKDSADNSVDAMSMYKMYHIYKNEYNKFNLVKRNRVFEKYYLYKCFAYLNYQELKRNTYLCNFSILLSSKLHFRLSNRQFLFLSYSWSLFRYDSLSPNQYSNISLSHCIISFEIKSYIYIAVSVSLRINATSYIILYIFILSTKFEEIVESFSVTSIKKLFNFSKEIFCAGTNGTCSNIF